MELYVLASGQMDSLNRWQQDLNSQFLPVYKNGKEENAKDTKGKILRNVQGKPIKFRRRLLVAPVQLFKIAFNKENLDDVLAMVCPQDYMTKRHKALKVMAKFFRKTLGLKEAPIPKYINPFMQPNLLDKAVAVMPLGIKEDMYNEEGYELI